MLRLAWGSVADAALKPRRNTISWG